MQIIINSSNQQALEPNERQAMEDYISEVLGRFDSQIIGVTAFLDDVNGPKGGNDKNCRLVAELPSAGAVVTEERSDDLLVAVTIATDEMARVVKKHWDRARDQNRQPRPDKLDFLEIPV